MLKLILRYYQLRFSNGRFTVLPVTCIYAVNTKKKEDIKKAIYTSILSAHIHTTYLRL